MQNKFHNTFREILKINIVYSAVLNVCHFGLRGLFHMPIVVQYRSTLRCREKGAIVFTKPLRLNMLTIKTGSRIMVYEGGKIVLTGQKACFNGWNEVLVFSRGTLQLGNDFWVNTFTSFNCRKSITIGDNALIGPHSLFLDTDYHRINDKQGNQTNPDKAIVIGERVWISSNVTVLKGSHIGNDSVIGACSLVMGNVLDSNSVYCGNPIRVVKSDITWTYW